MSKNPPPRKNPCEDRLAAWPCSHNPKCKRRTPTDTERLDWLIAHRGEVVLYDGRWWVDARESQGVGTEVLPEIYETTARRAIDAAMRAQTARGKR